MDDRADVHTQPGSRTVRRTVAALCAVQFVDVLGTTVVIAALPAMLSDLGAPASAASLVVPTYSVLFGALLMLGARLGDRYGHRRVLQVGLAVFAPASALAALAPSLALLVVGRCLLGAAAALSVPPALRLLSAATGGEQARRRALAAWSATGAAAGASGLVLGGQVTDAVGWRALFWLNLPMAAVLLVAVRSAPEPPLQRRGGLDVSGALLPAFGVGGLVGGASLLQAAEHRTWGAGLVAAGTASLAMFLRVERRAADPLLPRAALYSRALRSGAAVSFANTATTSSAVTLSTLYLQDTQALSPTAAGLTLLPFSLLVVVGAALSTRLMRRTAPRTTAAHGLGIIAAGNAMLLASPSGTWITPVAVGLSGLGIGLSSVAATTVGTAVADDLQGTAAGVLNTAAQLGTAFGVAAVLLVATTSQESSLPLAGTPLGWLAATATAALAAVLLWCRPAPGPDVARGPSTQAI